jgi:multicomponent Na+:H+ antiporter subunit B
LNVRRRRLLLLPALAVLGGALVVGMHGLPDFGHYAGPYGNVLNRVAVPERHTTNVVAATVFDYRGFDTLGEEFILFGAVVGVVLLLRGQTEKDEDADDAVSSDAVRLFGLLMLAPVLVVAAWLAAFGYITPGGGFQAGVVFAAAILLLYLAWGYRPFARATRETLLDPLEVVGAGGFVVIGLAALVSGLAFLHNLLGPGRTGTLLSGGSIAFLNWASALEVAAAILLLFSEFLAVPISSPPQRKPGA